MKLNKYHNSYTKRAIDLFIATLGILISLPITIFFSILIRLNCGSPVFFTQNRTGKEGKKFRILKFRTMKVGAEKMQTRYKRVNEASGPVFKIYNDPRFTKIGKVLAHTGLDELPQFINILKGDMSIVGPRPLPTSEARRIPKKYKLRELVRPGITSPWVVQGSHVLTFEKWMNLDREYVQNATFRDDCNIIWGTAKLVVKNTLKSLF